MSNIFIFSFADNREFYSTNPIKLENLFGICS